MLLIILPWKRLVRFPAEERIGGWSPQQFQRGFDEFAGIVGDFRETIVEARM